MIENFKKMQTGIDWHAFAGIVGTSVAVMLQNFNMVAAGSAATFTAMYMLLRVAREWRKIQLEKDEDNDVQLRKKNEQEEEIKLQEKRLNC